jgi:dienelactone hydrolase
MTGRQKIFVLAAFCLLLIWSYYARPLYDNGWVALSRTRDLIAKQIEPPGTSRLYDDVVAMNTRTVVETEAYIRSRRSQALQAPELTHWDYSSPAAFQASAAPLRADLAKALGLPLSDAIHGSDFSGVQETKIGEDDLATYTLLAIPALPGVNTIGTLIEPKNLTARVPLIVANYGRGDIPDRPPDGKMPIINDTDRDLARGAIQKGWAVFEPVFLFYGKDYPQDIREILANRAQEAGVTLPAIEITKLIRAIDYLTSRPEIDPQRLAMVGVSYGGFYTLYATALEPRIKVAAAAAYFNDRAAVLDGSEPYGYDDWRYPNSLSLFADPHIVALICPRPLQIQSGTQDQLFPIEGARRSIGEASAYYGKLHLESHFEYYEFTGRHEFQGEPAWRFIEKAFQSPN